MNHETRPSSAPSPARITVGIVLMMLIALWTFALPPVGMDEPAPVIVVAEVLEGSNN